MKNLLILILFITLFISYSSDINKYRFHLTIISLLILTVLLIQIWRKQSTPTTAKEEDARFEYTEIYLKMKRIIESYKTKDKSDEKIDEEDWQQLIVETDKRWNNITERLKARYNLTLKDIHICCLYLTDFHITDLKYFMNCSRNTIYRYGDEVLKKMGYEKKIISLREALKKV